ncbi:hypothetical protein CGRA01v4_11287 [Colletotrichum graminicola]|nr:hypothetical protein CGRA01v4_11287 [Colletotrichum graminicola]
MVAVGEVLLLVGLVLPAAAVKVGSREALLSSQTLQVQNEVGYWPIAPTTPPSPRFAAVAFKRQANTVCGYYSIDNDPFECDSGETCLTANGYFGCSSSSSLSLITACIDGIHTICSDLNIGPSTACWFVSTFAFASPFGEHALSICGGSYATITGFQCGNYPVAGPQLLLETPRQSTSVEITTTSTSTTTAPASATDNTLSETATPDSAIDNTPSEATTLAPSHGLSGATIGAIAGGVVGGLAVIGLTLFCIFWVFLRGHREKGGASAAPPTAMDQPYVYSAMPPSGTPHQTVAAPQSPVKEDSWRVSEAPAVNPPGMGNNASELPSQKYDHN